VKSKAVIILAGGKSSRLGYNKAFLKFNNLTLIERLINKMKIIAHEIILVTNQPELYYNFEVKCVTDEIKGKGPLGGIYSGLKSSNSWLNFIVACDMPFVDIGLVEYMFTEADGFDVVVPCINNDLEPLHAIYSKRCISFIEKCLINNQFRLISFYPYVQVKYLTENNLANYNLSEVFYNINTQADYQRAKDFLLMREETGEK
jgi:molybdopterin-guanine dinucleotide biosynthesis protein A